MGAYRIEFDPSGSFDRSVYEYSGLMYKATERVAARIARDLQGIIADVVLNAISEAGPGFPAAYAAHLLSGIGKLNEPRVYAEGDILVAEVYDLHDLGSYAELEQGFHYHAILNIKNSNDFSVVDPPRVELPYTGQSLYNDFEKRYEAWQTIVAGGEFEITFGKGKRSYTKRIPTTGLLDETYLARVSFWDSIGAYPEWLLLEYGTDTEPVIQPTAVNEFIGQRCYAYMEETWNSVFEALLDVWDTPVIDYVPTPTEQALQFDRYYEKYQKYAPATVVYESRGRGSKLRDLTTGRFV